MNNLPGNCYSLCCNFNLWNLLTSTIIMIFALDFSNTTFTISMVSGYFVKSANSETYVRKTGLCHTIMYLWKDDSTVSDSKVHGAYMSPTWGRHDPGGPHVGPMILAIWGINNKETKGCRTLRNIVCLSLIAVAWYIIHSLVNTIVASSPALTRRQGTWNHHGDWVSGVFQHERGYAGLLCAY